MPKEELDCLLEEVLSINNRSKESRNSNNYLIQGSYTGKISILKDEFNRMLNIIYEQEAQIREDRIEIGKYFKQIGYKDNELYIRQSELEKAHSQLKEYTKEIENINSELNRKVEELKNLFYFSQEVTSRFEKYDLLKIALKDIVPFIDSSFGAAFICNEKGLKLVDTYYKDSNVFLKVNAEINRFLNKNYFVYDVPIDKVEIYSDIIKNIKIKNIIGDNLSQEFKSLAIAPIVNKDNEVMAVIFLLGDYFDYSEKYLLSCYTNVLRIAFENARLYNDINKMFIDTVKVLANAIEVKDRYTKGHIDRVTDYSVAIAKKMNFDKTNLEKIKIAAALHDIGKIGIPDEILNKPSNLTKEEFDIVKEHPLKGYEIIKDIPALKDISIHVKQHHERIDGTGYPEGLRNKEISLEARIISVADAFDAMTSDRPYRKGMSFNTAVKVLLDNRGSQFDEYVVNVFLSCLQEIK